MAATTEPDDRPVTIGTRSVQEISEGSKYLNIPQIAAAHLGIETHDNMVVTLMPDDGKIVLEAAGDG